MKMSKNHGNDTAHLKASKASNMGSKKLKAESIKPAHNNKAKRK